MRDYKAEKARFDTRLTNEQKVLFERAAKLGGYTSLSDFVIKTVQKRAAEIIDENEKILTSQRDAEIFFEALKNYGEPNENLITLSKLYNEKTS
ncbi:MAG: DUF1778 domain-containing protein [Bacteroidales bacterium]